MSQSSSPSHSSPDSAGRYGHLFADTGDALDCLSLLRRDGVDGPVIIDLTALDALPEADRLVLLLHLGARLGEAGLKEAVLVRSKAGTMAIRHLDPVNVDSVLGNCNLHLFAGLRDEATAQKTVGQMAERFRLTEKEQAAVRCRQGE